MASTRPLTGTEEDRAYALAVIAGPLFAELAKSIVSRATGTIPKDVSKELVSLCVGVAADIHQKAVEHAHNERLDG